MLTANFTAEDRKGARSRISVSLFDDRNCIGLRRLSCALPSVPRDGDSPRSDPATVPLTVIIPARKAASAGFPPEGSGRATCPSKIITTTILKQAAAIITKQAIERIATRMNAEFGCGRCCLSGG
jgi:hypothetical protein